MPDEPETPPAAAAPNEPSPSEPASAVNAAAAVGDARLVDGSVATVESIVSEGAVSNETPAAVADASPAAVRPWRRPVVVARLRRLFVFALTVVLFVAGVTLGATTFQRTRPAPVAVEGAIALTDAPPLVTQEFITALAANDSDAMRSSLPPQPNKDLTDEFTRFDIKKVKSVDTLGTWVDGTRSATEILMHAEKSNGLPFEVNLVILVDGGQIEGFR